MLVLAAEYKPNVGLVKHQSSYQLGAPLLPQFVLWGGCLEDQCHLGLLSGEPYLQAKALAVEPQQEVPPTRLS